MGATTPNSQSQTPFDIDLGIECPDTLQSLYDSLTSEEWFCSEATFEPPQESVQTVQVKGDISRDVETNYSKDTQLRQFIRPCLIA